MDADKQLEKLGRILELIDGEDLVRTNEFTEIVEGLSNIIQTSNQSLDGKIDLLDSNIYRETNRIDRKIDKTRNDVENLSQYIDNRISDIKLQRGERGEKGEPGQPGAQGPQGEPGCIADMSPQEIRDLLELLLDDERLDFRAIKGLEDYPEIARLARLPRGETNLGVAKALYQLVDVEVEGLTIGQSIRWTGQYWEPYTPSGAAGFTRLTAAGSVNGANTDFTFTEKPDYIVADALWFEEEDSNGNTQWTWDSGSLTATMVNPPASSIYGFT